MHPYKFTIIILFGWLLAFVAIRERDPEALRKIMIWVALSMVFYGSVMIFLNSVLA